MGGRYRDPDRCKCKGRSSAGHARSRSSSHCSRRQPPLGAVFSSPVKDDHAHNLIENGGDDAHGRIDHSSYVVSGGEDEGVSVRMYTHKCDAHSALGGISDPGSVGVETTFNDSSGRVAHVGTDPPPPAVTSAVNPAFCVVKQRRGGPGNRLFLCCSKKARKSSLKLHKYEYENSRQLVRERIPLITFHVSLLLFTYLLLLLLHNLFS